MSTVRRENGATSPSPVALLIASLQVHQRRNRRRRVGVEPGQRRLLRRRQELAREAVGGEHPVLALDVDADPRAGGQAVRDADDRAAARVRDVEVRAAPRGGELGAAARAAAQRHRRRFDPERTPSTSRSDERPAMYLRAARRCRSAPRARLGRRKPRGDARDVGGVLREVAPPQRHAGRDPGQRTRLAGTTFACAIARAIIVVYAHAHSRSPFAAGRRRVSMRVILKLLSWLPLPALYAIGDALFFVTYHVLHWRRSLAAANLARSFPEKSAAERAVILRQSYRNLADLLAEIVWSFRATREEMRARVTGRESRS